MKISHYRALALMYFTEKSQGKDDRYLQASFHYTYFTNVCEIMNISSLKKFYSLSKKPDH